MNNSTPTHGLPVRGAGHTTGDAHEIIRFDTKHVVPSPRGRPHLVELQQIRVNEDTQLSCVAKRRHATFGFENPFGRPISPLFGVPSSGFREWCH